MSLTYDQTAFAFYDSAERKPRNDGLLPVNNGINSVASEDKAFHDWYRFVLSFPPHLVRDYIHDFGLGANSVVLDPFCGTGTTVVESKLNGLASIGIEANPFPYFASTVKTDWKVNPSEFDDLVTSVAAATYKMLSQQGIDDQALTWEANVELETLSAPAERAIISNSISPLPLHKTLVLLRILNQHQGSRAYAHAVLALGNALVRHIGNLRFGPEVGVGKIKKDAPVVAAWVYEAQRMIGDIKLLNSDAYPVARMHLADARHMRNVVAPRSVDAVITSPPYPNEKDYTRTTRLESVILGFYTDMLQIRSHKKRLLRSNTRGVYKQDDDDRWVANNERVQEIAQAIENRRIELGKTSGFERLYARVTQLYFGGMAKHFMDMTTILKPGARLAYVVGDQASYLQVMIRTGQILAEIAEEVGYEVERIDLFRTRFATATQNELREEVVILRWPGAK